MPTTPDRLETAADTYHEWSEILVAAIVDAEMYTDVCDVVERAWMHAPVERGDGELRCTSDYARQATNLILAIVQRVGRRMAALDGEVLDERDEAVQAADDLTSVVEQITGIYAGDHSNMNEPWKNAIEAGTAYANSTDLEYGVRWRSSKAMHREGMTEEQARNFVHPDDWRGSPVPVEVMFEIVRRRRGTWQVVP